MLKLYYLYVHQLTWGIIMKAAYIGIDILYPALTSLYDTGCEILKIFTCKTDNVTEFNTQTTAFAGEHSIPLQTDRIKREDLYKLHEMGCDFVLVGGYYHIIPVIEEMPIVNTHPSLLPVGRGAWPMPITILKGLKESGVTLHRMVKELDAGNIILQEKIPVFPEDDLISLSKRQHSVIPGMVKELVSDFDNLWNNAYPQPEGDWYWDMPTEDDYTVRSDMSYEEADLILRAFMGYECIYINKDKNIRLEFIEAKAHKGSPDSITGGTWPLCDGFITCERIRKL